MKDVNQIKIIQIATILQTIPGNNVMNGKPGFAIVSVEQLHNFGKQLMEIIEEDIEDKKMRITKG